MMKIGGLNRSIGSNSKIGCALGVDFKHLDGATFMSNRDCYGHLCTNIGAVWNLVGFYFDGVDDYVRCEDAIVLGNDDFNIDAVVIDLDIANAPYYLGWWDSVSAYVRFRSEANQSFDIRFGGVRTEVISSGKTFVDGQEFHLCAKVDRAGNSEIVVNGDPCGVEVTEAHGSISFTNLFKMGKVETAVGMTGLIKRVRITKGFADYAARILARSIDSRRN